MSISDVRSQADCLTLSGEEPAVRAGETGDHTGTLDVVRKARALFDLASMAGDARRLNPVSGGVKLSMKTRKTAANLHSTTLLQCPGHQPPKRAMHLLHGVAGDKLSEARYEKSRECVLTSPNFAAADMAVKGLALLCRHADAEPAARGGRVDSSLALRAVLQVTGGVKISMKTRESGYLLSRNLVLCACACACARARVRASVCVCVCVCARARASVCIYVRVCIWV